MIKAATRGAGLAKLRKALSEHLPFETAGAFHGDVNQRHNVPSMGRLNDENRQRLMRDVDVFGVVYVVWSYATPIAWVRGDGKVVRVDQRFSMTTSTKHQTHLYMMGE